MDLIASCCGMISWGMASFLRALVPDALPVAKALRDAPVAGDLVDDGDDPTVEVPSRLGASGGAADHLAVQDDGPPRPGDHGDIRPRGVEASRQHAVVRQNLDRVRVAVVRDQLPP